MSAECTAGRWDNGSADSGVDDGGRWFQRQQVADVVAGLDELRRWRRRSRSVTGRADESQM